MVAQHSLYFKAWKAEAHFLPCQKSWKNWKKVKGMRDRPAHTYFGVDYELLWRMVK
ncbi:MAG: DUF86 domain-containing protein [Aquificaceae bacterium]|uniref:HepT-like ribonuclease domain-containing protein n=1 Tax=Hydrogenobacter sp. Uz 6-8 TaxID=3384828 RepID=UPI0038FC6ED3